MAIDLIFAVLFLLIVWASLRMGWVAAVAALGLLAICMVAVTLAGSFVSVAGVTLVGLAVYATGLVLLSALLRRGRVVESRTWPHRVASAVPGSVQAVLVIVILAGALVGSVYDESPEAGGDIRQAMLYPALAEIGNRSPIAAALPGVAFPPPVRSTTGHSELGPVRPIDWAEATDWRGGIVRSLPGRIEAVERALFGFEIGGRVRAVHVQIGEQFEAGDILAELDTTAVDIALEERQAAFLEAQAMLAEARQNLTRQRTLRERGVVSEARYDSAIANLETARSREAVARAAIDRVRDQIRNAALRAPYGGTVASRLIEPGQVIAAGEAVLEIQSNNGGLEVHVTLPDTVVAQLSLGTEHCVRLLDGSGLEVSAVLSEIGTRATSAAGFPARLRLAPDAGGVRSGVSAEIWLRLDGPEATRDLVAVPLSSLQPGASSSWTAFVYDREQGRVELRSVNLVRTEGALALIDSGLESGEIVAARGLPFLHDGMPVALKGVGVARYEN